jgi:hypothetical protein
MDSLWNISIIGALRRQGETPVDQELYLREIQAAYNGEVRGEAFFRALADQPALNPIRAQLLVLAQLEAQTRARLEPLVRRLGLDAGVHAADAGDGVDRAARWDRFGPAEAIARLDDLIVPFVQRYDALAEAAAEEDRIFLDFLAAHERALASFSRLARDGRSDTALDAVLALLPRPDTE